MSDMMQSGVAGPLQEEAASDEALLRRKSARQSRGREQERASDCGSSVRSASALQSVPMQGTDLLQRKALRQQQRLLAETAAQQPPRDAEDDTASRSDAVSVRSALCTPSIPAEANLGARSVTPAAEEEDAASPARDAQSGAGSVSVPRAESVARAAPDGPPADALTDASTALRLRADALRADAEALDRARHEIDSRAGPGVAELRMTCEALRQRVRELEQGAGADATAGQSERTHLPTKAALLAVKSQLREQRELVAKYRSEVRDLVRAASSEAAEAVQMAMAASEQSAACAIRRKDECEAERQKLLQRLLELRGQVRVVARVRPLLPQEAGPEAMSTEGRGANGRWGTELTISAPAHPGGTERRVLVYGADTAMGCETSQADVYDQVDGMAANVVDGYSCCVLAYGQSGSGKTHTMLGTPEESGVAPRLISDVLRVQAERDPLASDRFEITASVEEVYCDVVYDLLDDSDSDERRVTLLRPAVRILIRNRGTDVARLIARAVQARWTGASHHNERSSRSHLVITIRVEDRQTRRCGELRLVDLAGSERLPTGGSSPDASGLAVKETQHINKSLSALGDVVEALATGASHVPFRNSRLTHLLAPSLGEGAKVIMLVTLSPAPGSALESLRSLQFAQRVRSVRLGEARLVPASPGPRLAASQRRRPLYRSRSAPNRAAFTPSVVSMRRRD